MHSANAVFLNAFQLTSQGIEGRRLDELGHPELAAPALRKLLDDPQETAEGVRLEQCHGPGDVRVFLVKVRRIESTDRVLVSFADVTAAERAERKIHQYQEDLQRMSFEAALAEERERRRLAVELHDRIGQTLALAEIKLTSVRAELSGDPRAAVDAAVALLEQAIVDKRALIFDLSPPILYDLGLVDALVWLAGDFGKRHGLKLEIADDGSDRSRDRRADRRDPPPPDHAEARAPDHRRADEVRDPRRVDVGGEVAASRMRRVFRTRGTADTNHQS